MKAIRVRGGRGIGAGVSCEVLEGRQLLSASATLDGGILTVQGTPRADEITLTRYIGAGGKVRIDVQRFGCSLGTFLESGVKSVRVRGGDGADQIAARVAIEARGTKHDHVTQTVVYDASGDQRIVRLQTLADGSIRSIDTGVAFLFTIPLTLVGGAGDDTLVGAVGDDHIEGGGGDDLIEGYDGDDVLLGQDGDDTIRGNDGDDYIDGAAGRDDVGGEGDPGAVNGLHPTTVFIGPSTVNRSTRDTVIGGNGGDRFSRIDAAGERHDKSDIDVIA